MITCFDSRRPMLGYNSRGVSVGCGGRMAEQHASLFILGCHFTLREFGTLTKSGCEWYMSVAQRRWIVVRFRNASILYSLLSERHDLVTSAISGGRHMRSNVLHRTIFYHRILQWCCITATSCSLLPPLNHCLPTGCGGRERKGGKWHSNSFILLPLLLLQ